MATYGGQDYTNFRAVNLRGSVGVRLQADAVAGTIRVDHIEADRAWSFPDKSGRFPVSGTFTVNLAAIVAGDFARTAVSVTGIRTEDAILVTVQGDPLKNVGAIQNPAQLIAAKAGDGSMTLTFASLGGTTTAYQDVICAYTAMR